MLVPQQTEPSQVEYEITPPGPWSTSAAFRWVQLAWFASPVFHGAVRSRARSIVFWISVFGRELTWRSGLNEFHSCAVCRKVSHQELFAKLQSLLHVLGCHSLSHYPRFKTIAEDRNKDRFEEWIYFANLSIKPLVPSSATHEHHFQMLELSIFCVHYRLDKGCGAYLLSRAAWIVHYRWRAAKWWILS